MICFLKRIILISIVVFTSCNNSKNGNLNNEKSNISSYESERDSLKQDSIYKNEWRPMTKKYKDSIAQIENKKGKAVLLNVDDILSIYSIKDQSNGDILASLKKYNSKWSLSTEGVRSYDNTFFIYSLLIDNDINKTQIINIDYKTNVLEYIFFDKDHINEIIEGINKINLEVSSVKKIENGDVTSYVSKEYSISIKIKDGITKDTKDCSIYVMKR